MRIHTTESEREQGTYLDIPTGFKFSAIGLPNVRVDEDVPPVATLTDDLSAARSWDEETLGHWKGWLGSLRTTQVREADLWLVAVWPADHPEVIDGDTRRVGDRSNTLYHAFVIAVDNVHHDEAIRLSGRNADGEPEVTGAQQYPSVRRVIFSPLATIGVEELQRTARLADALDALKGAGEFNRKWRMLRAFYRAQCSEEWGTRVHQFVRCVEGFVFPRKGRTKEDYAERTALFLGPGHRAIAEEMYDIRSAVEHLHGPLRYLPKAAPRRQHLRLLWRTIEAEALARYCLNRFLTRPQLWPYFDDGVGLEQFWDHLSETQRQALWGAPYDLTAATRDIEEDWIEDKDLGL
jgi:hypothetical protein